MELYYSPAACSLASRIALYECGAEARYTPVDLRTKRYGDGADYLAVNPMGQVPAIRTDDGHLLTENAVVLQYIADRHPAAGLAPQSGSERYRLQQWLTFIATELHKAVFFPLFDPTSNDGARGFAREKAGKPFNHLNHYLEGREFLLDRFTVADAYLVTVLNWVAPAGLDLSPWPAVQAYHQRLLKRPAVARACGEEFAMYQAGQAAQAAAAAN
jgi:glutathione S-transferase